MSTQPATSRPRVLITGPAEHIDEYVAAANEAGWTALAYPLLALVPLPLGTFKLGRKIGLLCVTSASTLPWIAELIRSKPKLLELRAAVVGERSEHGLKELGWRGPLERHDGAEELALALASVLERGGRVLWPRGDRSDALGQALREAGADVQDPVAYENRSLAQTSPPPTVDAVFFASPSAVRAWCEPTAGAAPLGSAPRAIAIGPTTLNALLEEKTQPFAATITLPDPTSEAFRTALAHLDP